MARNGNVYDSNRGTIYHSGRDLGRGKLNVGKRKTTTYSTGGSRASRMSWTGHGDNLHPKSKRRKSNAWGYL